MAKYKRVLIKLSGEALGDHGRLFDFEQIDRVAGVIGRLHETGTEIAIVIGAGNIWRGRQGPAAKMTAINADHMGMLGTAINSIAMQDAIERLDIPTRVMSAVEMTRFCEPYTYRRAVRHLEKGRIVIFACGTGNPFFSTDTAAALRAVEIGADAIYVGLAGYSARPKSSDFTLEEIQSVLPVIHEQGKKLFVAMNANVPDERIEELCEAMAALDDMGADALVTTEKDAVRFPRFETTPVKCLYLRIAIEILSGRESFDQIINRICFRKSDERRQ